MSANHTTQKWLITVTAVAMLAGLAGQARAANHRVGRLISQLQHASSDDARESAAKRLGELGAIEAINPLREAAVYDRKDDVRDAARNAVLKITRNVPPTHGRLGRDAVGRAMNALLHDGNHRTREDAARVLGQIGDTRALPALETAAIYDSKSGVRNQARRSAVMMRARLVHPTPPPPPAYVPPPAYIPPPTYVPPPPHRPVIVTPPPVIVQPPPVIVQPPPVVVQPRNNISGAVVLPRTGLSIGFSVDLGR